MMNHYKTFEFGGTEALLFVGRAKEAGRKTQLNDESL